MSTSFHYDGTDMSGSTYGLLVERSPWDILAAPSVDVQEVAQWFGGVSHFGGYGPRALPVEAVCIGTSRSNLLTKLDAIKYKLDPVYGEKTIKFDAFSDRYWYGRLVAPIGMEFLGLDAARLKLSFVAPDSRAWSTSGRTSPDFTIASDPDDFTVEAAAAVAGTARPECVWIVKAGASATQVILANTTTNESVTWNGSLSNGHWLRITTGLSGWSVAPVEKSTDSGSSWASAMSGVTGSFVFPVLKPGAQNTVTVTGVSAGTLTLSYTPRYL